MHVKTGTIKVGSFSEQITGGQAFYMHNHSRLILTGYSLDNANVANQNSTIHNDYEHTSSVLRIHGFSAPGADMSTHRSAGQLHMSLMGMDGNQFSKWFLAMKGDLTLSS